MQFKKDEIYERLIIEAEQEFLEMGFEKASVRQIAKRAGITIGNFYHYFKSKALLFDALVEESHFLLLKYLAEHSEQQTRDGIPENVPTNEMKVILTDLIREILPFFSKRFLILMESSAGTKHEVARQELVKTLAQHFSEHLKQLNKNPIKNTYHLKMKSNEENDESYQTKLGELLSDQLISSVTAALKSTSNTELQIKLITDLLIIMLLGVKEYGDSIL